MGEFPVLFGTYGAYVNRKIYGGYIRGFKYGNCTITTTGYAAICLIGIFRKDNGRFAIGARIIGGLGSFDGGTTTIATSVVGAIGVKYCGVDAYGDEWGYLYENRGYNRWGTSAL